MSESGIADRLDVAAIRIQALVEELEDIGAAPTRGGVSSSDLALCYKTKGWAALLTIAAEQIREAVKENGKVETLAHFFKP